MLLQPEKRQLTTALMRAVQRLVAMQIHRQQPSMLLTITAINSEIDFDARFAVDSQMECLKMSCERRPIDIARDHLPFTCLNCGAKELRVIETRFNNNAIRRRKHCLSCGNRETTYEISQLRYKQLQAVDKICTILLGDDSAIAKEPRLNCISCNHWEHGKCGMGFPEAGGFFADDCACYQKSFV